MSQGFVFAKNFDTSNLISYDATFPEGLEISKWNHLEAYFSKVAGKHTIRDWLDEQQTNNKSSLLVSSIYLTSIYSTETTPKKYQHELFKCCL